MPENKKQDEFRGYNQKILFNERLPSDNTISILAQTIKKRTKSHCQKSTKRSVFQLQPENKIEGAAR